MDREKIQVMSNLGERHSNRNRHAEHRAALRAAPNLLSAAAGAYSLLRSLMISHHGASKIKTRFDLWCVLTFNPRT